MRNLRIDMENTTVKSCRVCMSDQVRMFMDLGETALANAFLTKEELTRREAKYPLRVGFCHSCGHVQLLGSVPPNAMFENYLYISSMSDTLKDHLHGLARVVCDRFQLGPEDLVIDIGSNDGTLLSEFARQGTRTLGVDPAENLAEMAQQNGVETYTGYFGLDTATRIAELHGKASAITATNTFPHIQDLDDFVKGIDALLAPDGVFVLEFHYLMDILEHAAFDTIYHEHVSYWGLGPAMKLFDRHGFQIVDIKRMPIHHGQLRVFVQRKGQGGVSPDVARQRDLEKSSRLDEFETYTALAAQTARIKDGIRATLRGLRRSGHLVVGYGAPAKANTLLSYLGIGPETLPYIVDRSPLKRGRYTPGTHIPIVEPERLIADQPSHVLLLAWNFADEIMAQQEEYRSRGGKFILPLPEVRVV